LSFASRQRQRSGAQRARKGRSGTTGCARVQSMTAEVAQFSDRE
jgi:hypothetical protein